MEAGMSNLKRYQISRFFEQNTTVTQSQCDQEAERITGSVSARPSAVQGGGSYTVVCGENVVQFRSSSSSLDFALLACVEVAYAGFVPRHAKAGELGGLPVYTMNNIGGVSMYLARTELHRDGYRLLQQTLKDYAKFFASAWHNTQANTPSTDRGHVFDDYSLKLTQLAHGLPSRFRPTVVNLIQHLPSLFLDDWPMVPNHMDLLENNIHVDPSTGRLVGVCDWKDVQVGPFGISLYGLETMLGVSYTSGWRYHTGQAALRGLFWDEFYKALGTKLDEQRIEAARLVGIFLQNGWQEDDDGGLVPVYQEGYYALNYLDEVVLGIQGTDIIWHN